MARLHDSRGNLLGGLSAPLGLTTPFPSTPETPRTRLNPKFGAEETIPGLECSYGSFAYRYARSPEPALYAQSRLPGCHNPVEKPGERRHCDFCGGDYCSVHADPTLHDCAHVILPN